MGDRDDLNAERDRLMTEQERLLREGVPLEDLTRLADAGDPSRTSLPAMSADPTYDQGYRNGESNREADLSFWLNEKCGQPDAEAGQGFQADLEWIRDHISKPDRE